MNRARLKFPTRNTARNTLHINFLCLTVLKISKKIQGFYATWITNMINCIISENFIVIFDSSSFRLM